MKQHVRAWRDPTRKRNAHPEEDLQKLIAGHLDWMLPEDYWYTAIDHTRHGVVRGRALREMGVKRGVLDMLILGPNRFIGWLENKSLKGTLKPEQRATIAMLKAFGHQVAVCRSVDDALEALRSWGIALRETKPSLDAVQRGFRAVDTLEAWASMPVWPESDPLGRRRRKAK